MQNFLRRFSRFVPVSRTSAGTPFDMVMTPEEAAIPDLCFMFANPCTFDIWLEGTPVNTAFIQATPYQNGWFIPARTATMGPFTSKRPVQLSAVAFDNPCNPLPANQDFTGRYLILIYGQGS